MDLICQAILFLLKITNYPGSHRNLILSRWCKYQAAFHLQDQQNHSKNQTELVGTALEREFHSIRTLTIKYLFPENIHFSVPIHDLELLNHL